MAVMGKNTEKRQHCLVTFRAMLDLLKARDIETSDHLQRTQIIMKLLTNMLLADSSYKISPAHCVNIIAVAPLHDIGKIGICDATLFKSSRLTPEEFIDIQRHPDIGAEIISNMQTSLGNIPLLQSAYEVTIGHHEHFDGTGYPKGLKGWQIPLAARLMAIVDVYEALTSKRSYKEALSHTQALDIMTQNMCGHFDPAILERFFKMNCNRS